MNTSLLFAFDRANYHIIDTPKLVDVKMIDLGNMWPLLDGEKTDVGYIKGLEELIDLLTELKLN